MSIVRVSDTPIGFERATEEAPGPHAAQADLSMRDVRGTLAADARVTSVSSEILATRRASRLPRAATGATAGQAAATQPGAWQGGGVPASAQVVDPAREVARRRSRLGVAACATVVQ
jgi:hypothetical protein